MEDLEDQIEHALQLTTEATLTNSRSKNHTHDEEAVISQSKAYKINSEDVKKKTVHVTRPCHIKEGTQNIFPSVVVARNELRKALTAEDAGYFQDTILSLMRTFVSGVRADYESSKTSPIRSRNLSKSITRTMNTLSYFFTKYFTSTEHMQLLSELVAVWISCELNYAKQAEEMKSVISNRISCIINKHLKGSYKEDTTANILRMFLYISKLYKEPEVMTPIFEQVIPRPQVIIQKEFPDKIYILYLIVFYQWVQMENNERKRNCILDFADKFMRPAKTLCTNSTYAPFLCKYESRRNATKCFLQNMSYLNLKNAAILDNSRITENTVIDLVSKHAKARGVPPSDFAKNAIDAKSLSLEKFVKLEEPKVVVSIDLTDDSIAENDWVVQLRLKALGSKPSTRAERILSSQTKDRQDKEVPVVIVDLDSDSDCRVENDFNNTEPDLFSLDFEESESHEDTSAKNNTLKTTLCDDFDLSDDSQEDPTLIRFPAKLRTYSTPKEKLCSPQKQRKLSTSATISTVNEEEMRVSSEEQVLCKTNNSTENYKMPRILNSFSCNINMLPTSIPNEVCTVKDINKNDNHLLAKEAMPPSSWKFEISNDRNVRFKPTFKPTETKKLEMAIQTDESSLKVRKHVKFCDTPMGPIRSCSAKIQTSGLVSSKSSIKNKNSSSGYLKKIAERERKKHIQAIPSIFKGYDLLKELTKPHNPPKISKNIPVMSINDKKLNQKCVVVIQKLIPKDDQSFLKNYCIDKRPKNNVNRTISSGYSNKAVNDECYESQKVQEYDVNMVSTNEKRKECMESKYNDNKSKIEDRNSQGTILENSELNACRRTKPKSTLNEVLFEKEPQTSFTSQSRAPAKPVKVWINRVTAEKEKLLNLINENKLKNFPENMHCRNRKSNEFHKKRKTEKKLRPKFVTLENKKVKSHENSEGSLKSPPLLHSKRCTKQSVVEKDETYKEKKRQTKRISGRKSSLSSFENQVRNNNVTLLQEDFTNSIIQSKPVTVIDAGIKTELFSRVLNTNENNSVPHATAAEASSLALLANTAATTSPLPSSNPLLESKHLHVENINQHTACTSYQTSSELLSNHENHFTGNNLNQSSGLTIRCENISKNLLHLETTPTVPPYLFNGDSRDVPTPTLVAVGSETISEIRCVSSVVQSSTKLLKP